MSVTDLPFRIISKLEIGPGCWKWLGAHFDNGYGVVWLNGRNHRVHVVTYEAEFGPIPDGLVPDHVKERCPDGPPCCNPWHVEPVTPRENNLRGNGPAALNARKTHCKRGHEFTPENTYPIRTKSSYGIGRGCIECRRVQGRLNYDREAATLKASIYRAKKRGDIL